VVLRAGLDTEARGNILCLCRGSNSGRPVVQSILTELPQLYYILYTGIIYVCMCLFLSTNITIRSVIHTTTDLLIFFIGALTVLQFYMNKIFMQSA
jgi:hypothetical protein